MIEVGKGYRLVLPTEEVEDTDEFQSCNLIYGFLEFFRWAPVLTSGHMTRACLARPGLSNINWADSTDSTRIIRRKTKGEWDEL